LRRASAVVEVRLGRGPLLAAEGRVGEDHVELRGGAGVQAAVDLVAGQRVAVPDVRPVDAEQDQVRQADGVDEQPCEVPRCA
jgi:hypothetical protein